MTHGLPSTLEQRLLWFRPTRVIPSVAPARISLALDCFQALGIEGYTVGVSTRPAKR